MTDISVESQVREAERRGFSRGLNVGMVSIGVVTALVAAWRSYHDVPRFAEIFKQAKLTMPSLTVLVYDLHRIAAFALPLLALACVVATIKRGHQRWTIVMNAALFGSSLLWMLGVTASLYLPFMTLDFGIGPSRN